MRIYSGSETSSHGLFQHAGYCSANCPVKRDDVINASFSFMYPTMLALLMFFGVLFLIKPAAKMSLLVRILVTGLAILVAIVMLYIPVFTTGQVERSYERAVDEWSIHHGR